MSYKSILFFCGLMLLTHAAYGSTAEVFEIKVTGISSCQGNVMLAVYNNEGHFMNVEQAVAKEAINLATSDCVSTMLYRISIPYGQYSIVVYHDTNSNGIHDKNWFGVPTETWGVSNNARPLLREPKFSECAFTQKHKKTRGKGKKMKKSPHEIVQRTRGRDTSQKLMERAGHTRVTIGASYYGSRRIKKSNPEQSENQDIPEGDE